jgi:hypothetical protein
VTRVILLLSVGDHPLTAIQRLLTGNYPTATDDRVLAESRPWIYHHA